MLAEIRRPTILKNAAFIKLSKGKVAIVDETDCVWLSQFRWYAKKSSTRYYAVRKVYTKNKVVLERMHRLIAGTPSYFVCHHKNSNPLDNRRENLENMRRGDHDIIHFKT